MPIFNSTHFALELLLSMARKMLRITVFKSDLPFKPGFLICKILVVDLIHFLDIVTFLQ